MKSARWKIQGNDNGSSGHEPLTRFRGSPFIRARGSYILVSSQKTFYIYKKIDTGCAIDQKHVGLASSLQECIQHPGPEEGEF